MKNFSDNHNRAIRSLAQMVEGKITDLEGFFHTVKYHNSVAVSIVNDLSNKELEAISRIIENLHDELQQFCAAYQIERAELSLKRELLFKTAMLWQELSGATGKNMEGYGHFGENSKKEYDQHTSKMTELVNELYAICNKTN